MTLLRESGRHSKSSMKAVAIFLFWDVKSKLTVPGNEKVPRLLLQQLRCFRLLMSGKINPNLGPLSASTASKINCLMMN